MATRILVLDDEDEIRASVAGFLEAKGYEVVQASTCAAAETHLRSCRVDAGVLDYSLPDGDTLELLTRLGPAKPCIPLIIMTGFGTIELAVRAIKLGAEQFLTKPVELATIGLVLERALENQRNRQKQLASSTRERAAVNPFLGVSKLIRKLQEQAERVADSDTPVLITGETGSGKGVLARWIHAHSTRSNEAMVDLNCAGFSKEFLETELFGHERGAFTGAVAAKPGLLEIAHRGTVFLDEIGDMDSGIQPKLLKVLEDKQFRRLGDVHDRRVDIRLLAATHEDLGHAVAGQRFRSDLFFRINTVMLAVPSLRERPQDIPPLSEHLLEQCAIDMGRGRKNLAPECLDLLIAHPWIGNIRELKNTIERAVLFCDAEVIRPADLEILASTPLERNVAAMTLDDVEKQHVLAVLKLQNGHVRRAAKLLEIPVSTLYAKLKKYKIEIRPTLVVNN